MNSEDLARFVAANSPGRDQIPAGTKRNSMVPPVPKPGEVIICQQCGKPMLPETFSDDPKIRKHEFKWHIHWACEQDIWAKIDNMTPGLVAERQSMENPYERKAINRMKDSK